MHRDHLVRVCSHPLVPGHNNTGWLNPGTSNSDTRPTSDTKVSEHNRILYWDEARIRSLRDRACNIVLQVFTIQKNVGASLQYRAAGVYYTETRGIEPAISCCRCLVLSDTRDRACNIVLQVFSIQRHEGSSLQYRAAGVYTIQRHEGSSLQYRAAGV